MLTISSGAQVLQGNFAVLAWHGNCADFVYWGCVIYDCHIASANHVGIFMAYRMMVYYHKYKL